MIGEPWQGFLASWQWVKEPLPGEHMSKLRFLVGNFWLKPPETDARIGSDIGFDFRDWASAEANGWRKSRRAALEHELERYSDEALRILDRVKLIEEELVSEAAGALNSSAKDGEQCE